MASVVKTKFLRCLSNSRRYGNHPRSPSVCTENVSELRATRRPELIAVALRFNSRRWMVRWDGSIRESIRRLPRLEHEFERNHARADTSLKGRTRRGPRTRIRRRALNLACFPDSVRRLTIFDPDLLMPKLVAQLIAAAHFPVERAKISAEHLPFEDDRFDCVVSTFTQRTSWLGPNAIHQI